MEQYALINPADAQLLGKPPLIDGFFSSCCVVSTGSETTFENLYNSYVRWAYKKAIPLLSERHFVMELFRRGFPTVQIHGRDLTRGVRPLPAQRKGRSRR